MSLSPIRTNKRPYESPITPPVKVAKFSNEVCYLTSLIDEKSGYLPSEITQMILNFLKTPKSADLFTTLDTLALTNKNFYRIYENSLIWNDICCEQLKIPAKHSAIGELSFRSAFIDSLNQRNLTAMMIKSDLLFHRGQCNEAISSLNTIINSSNRFYTYEMKKCAAFKKAMLITEGHLGIDSLYHNHLVLDNELDDSFGQLSSIVQQLECISEDRIENSQADKTRALLYLSIMNMELYNNRSPACNESRLLDVFSCTAVAPNDRARAQLYLCILLAYVEDREDFEPVTDWGEDMGHIFRELNMIRKNEQAYPHDRLEALLRMTHSFADELIKIDREDVKKFCKICIPVVLEAIQNEIKNNKSIEFLQRKEYFISRNQILNQWLKGTAQ